ncbi:diguanylate cyclase [Sinimarinibacterium sp. NLF-5-8]|uniref:two-component system response regulator n=1 Tax=Sinimarinibacterium sp. NLF-5-8 TaxID=2698684 RepID=UPI00137BE4DF|nr:diguanylate cyclase [Sinimarinibacterium sp. NLF-5-8]QHS09570.1 GGDEF domain-containing response regulator [Sinimarinibacterium sp. NLF-5-8]
MPTNTATLPGKILVVDDIPANRVAMRRLLSKLDCTLIEAGSGNAALSACLDHEFALILLDVQMPEMDGFEVATLLSENETTAHTPIIFVTAALTDDLSRLQGYRAGAVDYIAKPVNEFILLSKVKVFLDLYHYRCALAAAEAHARHLATHDPLTGLPNRLLFSDRLTTAVARAQRENRWVALIYIDLDHFKPINDRYGHPAGDVLLRTIGKRLSHLFRDSDTPARLGGDEFAVILESLETRTQLDALCARLVQTLEQPVTLDRPETRDSAAEALCVQVGISLGIALCPDDGTSAEALIHAADLQMYQHKQQRR